MVVETHCIGTQCQFTHIDQEGNFHHFDFSPLALSDFVAQDSTGHTYHFNICGKLSSKLCHDEKEIQWALTSFYRGIAVQSWGPTPPCNSTTKDCYNSDFESICCTQACQVLATSWQPSWRLADPSNPATGGVVVSLPGVAKGPDPPCPLNTVNGGYLYRTFNVAFECEESIPGYKMLGVVQNRTDDCDSTARMATRYACSKAVKPK